MNTIASVPDNFYKFLIICGIGLMVYSYSTYENLNISFIEKTSPTLTLWDSIENNLKVIEFTKNKTFEFVNSTKDRFGADSLFLNDGKNIILNQKSYQKISDSRTKDSAIKILNDFHEQEFYLVTLPLHKFEIQRTSMKEQYDELKEDVGYNSYIIFVSLTILAVGLLGFLNQQIHNDRKEKIEFHKSLSKDWCQSCGQLFSGINIHGQNTDGTTNEHFCKNCYNHGEFRELDLTLEAMLQRTKDKVNFKNLSSFKKNKIIKRLRKLHRWNENRYDFS